jgi:acetyl/propionyl-CoA carboxylase alpha subunit
MAKQDDTQHGDASTGASQFEGEEPSFRLDHEITRRYDPSSLSKLIVRDAGRGEPLDLHTRALMESRLGGNFSNVRIIRGPLAEEVTARYRADAVTVGGTELVLVREGWRSNFQTIAGQSLLAHELTHVQQGQRGLHFAHTPGGHDEAHSALEEEAEMNEHMMEADQKGGELAREAEKRRTMAHDNIWEEVRKRVPKLLDDKKKKGDERGNPNLQSNWDQNS